MAPAEPARVNMQTDQPNIKAVRPADGQCLIVTWKGGAESVVDVSPYLAGYAVFVPLLTDDALFRHVVVGDWGWSVHWTDELEMSADTLWRSALEQGAEWLRTWRETHNLTQREAAYSLGVSPRMWRYYEAGTHLLPKTVRLAAVGLDAQLRAA